MVSLTLKIIFSALMPLSLSLVFVGMAGPLALSGLFLMALFFLGCFGLHWVAAVLMLLAGVAVEAGELASGLFPMGRTKPDRWAIAGSFVGGMVGALGGGLIFFPLGALPGTFLGTFSGAWAGAFIKNPSDSAGALDQARALLMGRVAGTVIKLLLGMVMLAIALWIIWTC